MGGHITIAALESVEEIKKLFESLASDDKSEFRRALDLDISHVDPRAQAFDVRVVDVVVSNERIQVHYELDYNVYNGCKDMDIDDTYEGCAVGVSSPDGWIFEEFIPPPRRTTLDEY